MTNDASSTDTDNLIEIGALADEFDEEIAKELAGAFLEDTGGALAKIESSLVERQSEGVRSAAHMLKGCSRVVKAHACERASRTLEEAAIAQDWEKIVEITGELRNVYSRTQKFIEEYIGQS